MIRSENKFVRFILYFLIFFITRLVVSVLMDLLRNKEILLKGELIEFTIFSLVMALVFQISKA